MEAANESEAQLFFVSTWQMFEAISALCNAQDPVTTVFGPRSQEQISAPMTNVI
jgi:hypothetical protein